MPEFYFDTVVLNEIVLGLEAFYTLKVGFKEHEFKSKKTLVNCLLYSGWLGPFQLLPPHQLEFYRRVKNNFGMGIESDPNGRAATFFEDALADPSLFNIASPDEVDEEQLREFLKGSAGLAEDLFKAFQCVLPWHDRLARLERHNVIRTEKPKLDLSMYSTELFQRLKRSFDDRRPSPNNNFHDAAAVYMLIDLLEKYNSGAAQTVPRFYSSSPLFEEVLADARGLRLLKYTNRLGGSSGVLRDSDYYIFKASFRQRQGFAGQPSPASLIAAEEYLRGLHKEVSSIVESQEMLTADVLEKMYDGKSLGDIMKDLQTFSFLENVWLKYEAPQEGLRVVREVIEAAQGMQNEAFKQKVAGAIDSISKKLEENVKEYKWLSSFWLQLEKKAMQLRKSAAVNNFSSPALFRDFGLLRYGFPADTHENIRNVLKELLHGGATEIDALSKVTMACRKGSEDPVANLSDLVMGAAILVVTKMEGELFSLLEEIDPLPHYSLKIALAQLLLESSLESSPESERAAELLDQLVKEHRDSPPDSQVRADLAVGIAYLSFRLWHRRGGRAMWRTNIAGVSEEGAALAQPLVDRAITYAQEAHAFSGDMMKKAYALNLCLYYSVEGGRDARMPEMDSVAGYLVAYKSNRELWQYRFDDTLARYFHRSATLATSEAKWDRAMAAARIHIEEAYRDSHGDKEVETNYSIISHAEQQGYQAKINSKGVVE